jgi:hypothetical protein
MAGELAIVKTTLLNWVLTPAFWLVIIAGIAAVAIAALYVRKRRRLTVPTIELVDYGNGKIGINKFMSGWFGKELMLKGLWWKGVEVLRAASGEEIRDFSTQDYQTIDGKRGVVCFRSPTNQDILVPISKCKVVGKEMVADIAPAEYIDAAKEQYSNSKKETIDTKEKMMQFLGWSLIIIASLLMIIFIIQGWKHVVTESKDLLLQAGSKGLANCKSMCSDMIQVFQGLPK